MAQYIDKSAVVAEIEKLKDETKIHPSDFGCGRLSICKELMNFLSTLEVKEVDEQKERMSECPYRIVGCTQFSGTVLECKGACTWLLIMQKYKGLEVKKGE